MFEIGDVVKFKNNLSPPMTVEGVEGDTVHVVWFGDNYGELREAEFSAELLKKWERR